jgi:uroporphyrinogen decarboxylase
MNDTFLKACRAEPVPYTPVWLMRQAGRYMPQYQEVRRKVDFLTLCKSPELAAQVTLQPVEVLGVDAAILFSDILIPVEAMGMRLEFSEQQGPVLSPPVRGQAELEGLRVPEPSKDVPFVLESIRLLRQSLQVPLIGFSGAPFTLATYMVEGGGSKSFFYTKWMMFRQREVFLGLLQMLTETVCRYLRAQIEAGAQAVQLFDTWAGILGPQDYRTYALPYVKQVVRELKGLGVPIIYFLNGCAGLLEEMLQSGADVLSLDWRIDIAQAARSVGAEAVLQGNLDPCALLLPRQELSQRVQDILQGARAARGHVFNLGHGVLPQIPLEAVKHLVQEVHRLSRRS